MIDQIRLESINSLKAKIKLLSTELSNKEGALLNELKDGAKVCKGSFPAFLKDVEKRKVAPFQQMAKDALLDTFDDVKQAHLNAMETIFNTKLIIEKAN